MTRILALVVARSGSKRLPGKNIRPLGGKPLILWSLDSVTGIKDICDVMISTDDPEIALLARNAGAYVPWLRPSALSEDASSMVDVALHALDFYEREHGAIDGILLLQPTSPFRTRETVLRGLNMFLKNKRSILAISEAKSHPMWCFSFENDKLMPFIDGPGLVQRSQDLPKAYVVNGSFYLITPEELRVSKSFYNSNTMPLYTSSQMEGIDIDTEADWEMAEYHLMKKNTN